MNFYQSYKQMS